MNHTCSFLFPDRITRLAFLLRYVLLVLCTAGNAVFLYFDEQSGSAELRTAFYVAATLLGLAILVAAFRSVLFPRLRDIGLTGGYALLIFVPVVNVALLLGLLLVPTDAFSKAPVGT
ncbi:DUF805 domain-containing protein [Verrucomicrobiota bacterium sgz303538]